MNRQNTSKNTIADNRWIFAVLLLFVGSTIVRGVLSDFPKALRIYPDELRYVGIANSLFKGQGLRIHNMDSDFQKILYSICIMPAFLLKTSSAQIRAIGYINGFIVSSSIFPVYALCRKMLLGSKEIGLILAFWTTLPTLLVSMYFMSEIIYLPLSLCLVYCVWCTWEAEKRLERIAFNFLLGILCYLAYLCKEIALYFILAYMFVCVMRIFARQTEWKQEILCLIVFSGVFACCFWGMKEILFSGLNNSYSSSILSDIKGLDLFQHPDKMKFLIYAFVYDTIFAVVAFGVFPILVPVSLFNKDQKESWFYLFLLSAFLIGCIVIAYTITLPEELGKRSPRQYVRYLEPLAVPFYIMMVNNIKRMHKYDKTGEAKIRFKILVLGMIMFVVTFVVIGAGGGSNLVDNNMLVYYEFFARFICKSDALLLAVRMFMAFVLGMGIMILHKNKENFLRLFGMLFIGINLINSVAGYFACSYRYTIDEVMRAQASEANDYLWNIQGNILLVTDEGVESEDCRLFDTYVTRDFYVAEIGMMEADGFLDDSVLDLQSEYIRCGFPYDHYTGLTAIDYLIVKEDYGICFQENSVEEIADFPMEGYKMYRNKDTGLIQFII